MIRGDSGIARRRAASLLAQGAILGAAAFALAACGGSSGSGQSQASHPAAAAPKTVHVLLTGKTDAPGAAAISTGKDGWPSYSPSVLHVAKGDTVVLTIKEYDDAPTALPAGSPYNAVRGGTETANGSPVTTVSNSQISHTFTIPALGINVPLPKASNSGATTVVFTFKAGQSGTFTWQCMTPCGGGSKGMGGAMAKYDWMKGHLIVG